MSTPTVAKPLLPASSFDFLRWLHSFWVKKKQRYSLQVDMQYAFDALVAAIAGTQGWPATAAGVERIASKAGSIVTALRNRYKTGSVEKLVFILSNKEFTPKVEEVVDAIKKKRDERKKRFKEARSVAKAAAMRTGSASQAPAAVSVVPQVGDEVGVVQMSRRHLKRTSSAWISMKAAMNSIGMLFRLFWTAFTMPIHPQKKTHTS